MKTLKISKSRNLSYYVPFQAQLHTGRNRFNLFQISFPANTTDTPPGVSGMSKDQKFCEKFKNAHCQTTIQPKLNKIKKHFWCISNCLFYYFTQFWLDGRPGNEHFSIFHKISDLLTPLTLLCVHLQWFETIVWNR